LIKASREIKVIREERERRERAWAEHLRQQEIARKQAEFRKRREEDFVRSIDRWHEAERMRQYLEAVKKRAEAEGIEEDSNFVVWYRWACSRASLLDPLMDGASSDALVPVTLSFWYRWMR
jgi:hypothetical protein